MTPPTPVPVPSATVAAGPTTPPEQASVAATGSALATDAARATGSAPETGMDPAIGMVPATSATSALPATVAARRADAVVAHRAEWADRRRLLAAGPRADVATVLDLARLACLDELAGDLAGLSDRVAARIEQARPDGLRTVPETLASDLAEIGRDLDRTFTAHTAPALRRLAARLCPGAQALPVPVPVPELDRSGADVLRAAVPPPPATGAMWSDPRLLGTLAGLPVLAVHGLGPGSVLVAAGAVLLAGCLGRARAVAVGRSRLTEHLSRSVAAAGAAGERELRRRLIETEAAVVAALERAVRDHLDPGVRDAAR